MRAHHRALSAVGSASPTRSTALRSASPTPRTGRASAGTSSRATSRST